MERLDSELEIVVRHLPTRGKTVVDVGCGTGAVVRHLTGLGARVIGVDLPEMVAQAEARPRVGDESYVSGTAEELPVADELADGMLYLASLHHVPAGQMIQALRECARVLKPGGRALYLEPLGEPGSYFELIRLVEDEREIQKLALGALRRAGEVGLRPAVEESLCYVERSLDDFRQLLETFVPEPERRQEYLRQAEQKVAQLAGGDPLASAEIRFRSIARVHLLHKS